MSVATEIAVASLKDDVDVEDPNSDANKTLLGSLRQIRAWAGCSGVRWGVEDGSKTLRLFVDWESIEAHAKANQQPLVTYQSSRKLLTTDLHLQRILACSHTTGNPLYWPCLLSRTF